MPIFDPPSFETGEIVIVPFPYSDKFAEKRRPAVVVSNARLAKEGFLWIVMVTSSINRGKTFDRQIADLALSGLSAPSIVRPTKIANVEPSRVIRRAGRLGAAEVADVLKSVRSFINSRRIAGAAKQK